MSVNPYVCIPTYFSVFESINYAINQILVINRPFFVFTGLQSAVLRRVCSLSVQVLWNQVYRDLRVNQRQALMEVPDDTGGVGRSRGGIPFPTEWIMKWLVYEHTPSHTHTVLLVFICPADFGRITLYVKLFVFFTPRRIFGLVIIWLSQVNIKCA